MGEYVFERDSGMVTRAALVVNGSGNDGLGIEYEICNLVFVVLS